MAETMSTWKLSLEILKAAAKEFGSDKAGRLGAALSYYTIFSLVPLIFLVVAVAGFVLDDPQAVDDLVSTAEEVAGEAVAGSLGPIVDTVTEQAGTALTIGVLLAAFSASGIFLQVQGVLNALFHVPDERVEGIRALIAQRLIALVAALLLAVFVLVPIIAVAAIGWIRDLVRDLGLEWLVPVLSVGVPLAALVVVMLSVGITFQAMTRVKLLWPAALRGGAFTAVVGLVAAYGVGWYLSRDSGGDGVNTLAVAGGIAILLFFFNMMWTVYLFGAEVTKVYGDYLRHGNVLQPSIREGQADDAQLARLRARAERRRPGKAKVAAETGVVAFVTGMIVGWLGGRR